MLTSSERCWQSCSGVSVFTRMCMGSDSQFSRITNRWKWYTWRIWQLPPASIEDAASHPNVWHRHQIQARQGGDVGRLNVTRTLQQLREPGIWRSDQSRAILDSKAGRATARNKKRRQAAEPLGGDCWWLAWSSARRTSETASLLALSRWACGIWRHCFERQSEGHWGSCAQVSNVPTNAACPTTSAPHATRDPFMCMADCGNRPICHQPWDISACVGLLFEVSVRLCNPEPSDEYSRHCEDDVSLRRARCTTTCDQRQRRTLKLRCIQVVRWSVVLRTCYTKPTLPSVERLHWTECSNRETHLVESWASIRCPDGPTCAESNAIR